MPHNHLNHKQKGIDHGQHRRCKQSNRNDQISGAVGLRLSHRLYLRVVYALALFLVCLTSAGCFHDNTRDRHAAKMFANILVTAEAQLAEGAPPVEQTAGAIQTAARAGLKVLGFELER